eukprot:13454-Heterococcus_DN1.PRE.6
MPHASPQDRHTSARAVPSIEAGRTCCQGETSAHFCHELACGMLKGFPRALHLRGVSCTPLKRWAHARATHCAWQLLTAAVYYRVEYDHSVFSAHGCTAAIHYTRLKRVVVHIEKKNLCSSFELLDLSQQCVLASTHHFTNLSVVLHIGEETRERTLRTVSEVAISLQQREHVHCIHQRTALRSR